MVKRLDNALIKMRPALLWLAGAAIKMGYFGLSLICGIVIPLSTLAAEWRFTGKIEDVSWFSAGVTYVAGVGLASRYPMFLLFMLLMSALLAFLYGADLMADVAKYPHLFSSTTAIWCVAIAAALYAIERFGLHVLDSRSFPG
jgi:hypothetical protein